MSAGTLAYIGDVAHLPDAQPSPARADPRVTGERAGVRFHAAAPLPDTDADAVQV